MTAQEDSGGSRHKGRHDDPRKVLYDNRGSRGVARRERRTGGARLSRLDHNSFLSGSRDRPALAFLFRLAARVERRGLCRQPLRAPPFEGFPALRPGAALNPESIWRASALAFSQGRRRFALQCAAKAGLPFRHRRAADSGPGRPDDVAGDRRRFPVAGRPVRRTPVGAHDPFHPGLLSRRLCYRSRRDGAGLRFSEQHDFDDHRPLRHRGGRHEA